METLKAQGGVIRYIYQISDIHIRQFDRHDEYRKVFNKMYEYLKTQPSNESLIIICGDILHNKSEISAECWNMVHTLFKELAKIMPIIFFSGNHDLLVTNKENRLGALDVVALWCPKAIRGEVHYLEKTGFYRYENIVFGFTNVRDTEILDPSNIQIEASDNLIALFHGIIDGCECETGIAMNSNFKISDRYDYALLGDVHKHQIFGERKNICYAGSLIQQNFGESINNHGLVKLDLQNQVFEFVNIPNKHGYFVINVNEGKYHKLDTNTLPEKLSIRLDAVNTSNEQIEKIKKELADNVEIVSLFINRRKSDDGTLVNTQELNKIKESDVKIIKKYLREKYEHLTKEEVDEFIDMHRKYEAEYLGDTMEKCQKMCNWTPIKLKFKNLFAYKEKENVINFSKLNGVISIEAPNDYGKSSIFDILLFAIYGKCSKGLSDVINHDRKTYTIDFIFMMDDKKYRIHREGKIMNKTSKLIKSDAYFVRYKGDTEKYLSSRNIDTNKKILEYFCPYNMFIATILMLQNDQDNNFINMSSSARTTFLCTMLDLDKYSRLYKMAHTKIISEKAKKEVYEQILENNKGCKKAYLLELKTLHQNWENKINSLEEKRDKLQVKIQELYKKIKKIDQSDLDYHELETQRNELRSRREKILESIKELTKKISQFDRIFGSKTPEEFKIACEKKEEKRKKYLDKINELKQQIIVNDENYQIIFNELRAKYSHMTQTEQKLHFANQQITSSITKLKEKLKQLRENTVNGNIDYETGKLDQSKVIIDMIHGINSDQVIRIRRQIESDMVEIRKRIDQGKMYEENKKLISQYQEQLTQLGNKLQLNSQELKHHRELMKQTLLDLQQITAKVQQQIKTKMKNSHLRWKIQLMNMNSFDSSKQMNQLLEYQNLLLQKKTLNEKLIKVKSNISEINNKLDDYLKNKKSIDENKEHQNKIDSLTKTMNDVVTELKENNKKLIEISEKFHHFQTQRKTYIETKEKYDRVCNRYENTKLYADVMQKNGIQNYILNNSIKRLENAVNDILKNFANFTVAIMIDKSKIGIKIIIGNGQQLEVSTISGSAKFILSVCLRMGIAEIATVSKSNFLGVDEGFSALDAEKRDAFKIFVEFLRTRYKFVLFMSHVEYINSLADDSIIIRKDDVNGSFIE